MTLQTILDIMKEKNYRITNQRRLILDVLVKHQSILLSAEEILQEVQKTDSDINLTTVYRNIELLSELELLYALSRDRKTQAYKIRCMGHHHHHITCTECGHMMPIDYCPVSEELQALTESDGYLLTGHTLELYGICKDCQSCNHLK